MKSIFLLITIFSFSPLSYGCFGQLASSISQGISQKYEMEKNNGEQLMKLASDRTTVSKDCREELQAAMVKYRTERRKLERVISGEKNKVEKAEIEYESAVLDLKSECEEKANEEFVSYKQQQYSLPIGDPTAIASYEQTVNKGWRIFYLNCWVGPGFANNGGRSSNARQAQVNLLARKLDNAIKTIREDVDFAKKSLQELHQETTMIQATTQQNCREGNDLIDYNESVIASIHAKGLSASSQMQSINTLGAVMSCMSSGGQNGTNGSNPSAL